ncbi:aspartate racemase [Thermoclostridium stercorarium subsp. stercorarium DSM 8532]|jgi:aspartate racemase|uniref:Aspartate racemase n=3 Tax=Thermoclostridium stercorarium TaxID=1510 RepID=L7VT10_THES1|nr:amino acid racemase [Thermoclostridium stercorarium]AGC68653.1 aspartate racemase [Thermoclostridium stercorarium subsp. stercorarium DSM 8532]AGI39665.1 aspartate racemase [Thermoclostridium stercorarium subsp. stercorarium DSM 8532]ANW98993.1 aspartate racemase [Thermoclostridium stercorarium subsp. thermolacticum DSM 2910]ANX01522.1 aspartate racemase [Thermoclostridium stercorarium subsp. leptospartum DSM 9219]UZQ84636.1 amino acid racemase [Thermoclostridium stercorarium]
MLTKKLGVIGGLGPLATACFMEMVVKMTDARTDREHIPMIVYSKPSIPDRTDFILGKSSADPCTDMVEIGKILEELGADFIAVPCVTAYFFYERLCREINVPIIDMIGETAIYLKNSGVSRVGIMATDGTVTGGFLRKGLEKYGLEVVQPSASGQKLVMNMIYNGVKANMPIVMDEFYAVKNELLEAKAEVIVLGCTELSVIHRDYDIGPGCLDAMEVLAQKSVLFCGGKIKNEYRKLIT